MKPVVDHAEFDRIACNRCGACCEGFTLDWDPAERLEDTRQNTLHYPDMTHEQTLVELETIVDMLLPAPDHPAWVEWQEREGEALWTCRHFSRDADGLGSCGIYERRPWMCSSFPNGRPNRMYTRCSFNVKRIVRHLPVLSSRPARAPAGRPLD